MHENKDRAHVRSNWMQREAGFKEQLIYMKGAGYRKGRKNREKLNTKGS
jgi:hypothetical protein